MKRLERREIICCTRYDRLKIDFALALVLFLALLLVLVLALALLLALAFIVRRGRRR